MCWTVPVTIGFSIAYGSSILYYKSLKPQNYKGLILFNSFFMIMELYQLFQWLFGDVHNCSLFNTRVTYIGYILIWLQPLLFSYIGYIESKNYKREIFRKLCITKLPFIFLIIFTNIYVTEFTPSSPNIYVDSSYSNRTCTLIGPYNHLAWEFKSIHIDYQANHLLYFILCCISFIFYDNHIISIPISWFLTLSLTFLSIGFSFREIPSFWCYLSAISVFVNFLLTSHN